MQKVSARYAVAKVNPFVGIKPEHFSHPITDRLAFEIAQRDTLRGTMSNTLIP